MLELRQYQKEAVEKLKWSFSLKGNDICVLPTGAGKSVVIANLATDLDQDILILQPSKEILEQNYAKLNIYVDKSLVGVYSASMDRKEVKKYTFATIQSIYQNPELFSNFKTVIIDECHLVNPKNLGGMYTKFLQAIGEPKVYGFTATPYRLTPSYFWRDGEMNAGVSIKMINRTRPQFWNRIVYSMNTIDLINQGYLCKLEYLDYSIINQDNIKRNKSQSDFDLFEVEKQMDSKKDKVLNAIAYAENTCKSILVFCTSIKQAKDLKELVPGSEVITGKDPKERREYIIKAFKAGIIKIIFNVGVLTTGFDFPGLDCIILARPTQSLALYYQMLGRGLRTAEGKESCLVIDLSNTVARLGKVESIKTEKIENKWDVTTDKQSWHGVQLYSYQITHNKTLF